MEKDHEKTAGETHSASKSLFGNVCIDVGAALTAATAVTPVMTVIDRAVTEAASGHDKILRCVRNSLKAIVTAPRYFLLGRPFAVMFLLYSGTFITANTMDTLLESSRDELTNPASDAWLKSGAVTLVNMGLSLYKDSHYARLFGTRPIRPLPLATYPLFIARDGITIFASFSLPELLVSRHSHLLNGMIDASVVAQLAIPSLSQFVTSPLHLLGLDLYNRYHQVSWRDRARFVRGAWMSTSFARSLRIFPAYGLGVAVNNSIRTGLMDGMSADGRRRLDGFARAADDFNQRLLMCDVA